MSAPDYPPEPANPADVVEPDGRVWLTADQAAFVAEFVKHEPDARAIEIVEREAGHFSATVYDDRGMMIDVRSIHPVGNRL